MMVYTCICYKFHENILNGNRVMEQHDFHTKKFLKGHNTVKNVGGVSVLVLCTSSDDGLYLLQLIS